MTLQISNYCQVVPNSHRCFEEDIKLLAYRMWEQADKPKGRDKEIYLEAEETLNLLANTSFTKFLELLYDLRGELEKKNWDDAAHQTVSINNINQSDGANISIQNNF